jgi:formyl-CoA transferase
MYDVMDGVRVVEVAEHTFVPAAAMILADWGADVIKVERAQGGDASRHLKLPGVGGLVSPFFETGNRGKRSIGLDLTQPAARDVLYRLIREADVFVTNMRASARKTMGIEPETLMAINPRLIYARGTGYGLKGKMANDGGFDFPSSWCRSGSGYAQTFPGGEPPLQPGSVGDLTGGATLCGAICAALFRRERTGKGAIVDNALYQMGIYIMSQSIVAASVGLPRGPAVPQAQAFNALINSYRTKDERWLNICLLMEKWWPDFLAHIERPDLGEDPRFATAPARSENARALTHELNAVFAQRTYAEWCEKLATMEGVWAPMQNSLEVMADPQATENGFIAEIEVAPGESYKVGVAPGQFDERPVGELRPAPRFNADGAAILAQAGFSADEVAALQASGAVAA